MGGVGGEGGKGGGRGGAILICGWQQSEDLRMAAISSGVTAIWAETRVTKCLNWGPCQQPTQTKADNYEAI